MKALIKRKKPEPNRAGPGILMGMGYGMAMAAKIRHDAQVKEEKARYAETHEGRKVPRRSKKG